MQAPLTYRDDAAIRLWLVLCALLVVGMVAVGGYTRLSGSGLSITQWKPIHGVVPPMGEQEWQEEFDLYRATPQYEKVNAGMTMEDFKAIFWPEFLHRLLARAVGLVFFVPLLAFAVRRSISKRFFWRLTGIFALGGAQGLMGWLMVASGLVDAPYVSHLRLAAHLSLAFLILALILWCILDLKQGKPENPPVKLRLFYQLWFAALCVQIVWGAFVAGTHAGLMYNSFPTMNGQFLPSELWEEGSVSHNLFFNLTLIQFIHRWLAVAVAFGFIFWWYKARSYVTQKASFYCFALLAVIAAQFTLGVLTLLWQVPLHLALAHQLCAVLLFSLAVIVLHKLTKKTEVQ